jgi:hypothetical protein
MHLDLPLEVFYLRNTQMVFDTQLRIIPAL